MARHRDPDEPKIYFLPNLMTAGNLACGFFAVLMIFKALIEVQLEAQKTGLHLSVKDAYEISRHYYEYAILLIFGSCLFDLLDGRLARLGGQDSPFGREFDSLADIISFGMAPAMLVFKAVLLPLEKDGWGMAIALVYLLCGAMRLARFNCLAALPKRADASTDFRGIPIPMAAGFIASLTFFIMQIYENDRDLGWWKYAIAGAMLGLSWLMISDVRYPSFKKVDWRTRSTVGALVVAAVIVIMAVKFKYIAPVVVFSAYLLYGLIRPWVSLKLRKEIEADEDEDTEDAEHGGIPK